MNSPIKYVYICSAGHSGSTLLDLLLGSHSKIESLGEIAHLSKNISLNTTCTCGATVRTCPVWKNVIRAACMKLDTDILMSPYNLNMGFPNPQVIKDKIHTTLRYQIKRKILRGLQYFSLKYDIKPLNPLLREVFTSIDHTLMVYEEVRTQLGCQIVVDSSKSYIGAAGIYSREPENVRIILLTRDGRGVTYSNMKRKFPRNKAIIGWRKYYSRAIRLFDAVVDERHLIQVKYEDIVKEPSAELERICSFLNLQFEADMLNFANHTHHITNGNNMRFIKSSEIRADNSWKTGLAKCDLEYFQKHAGDINRQLGYI